MISGSAPLITGLTGFVGLHLIPDWLIFGVFLGTEQLWLLGLAYLLWRRAGAISPRPHLAEPQPRLA